MPRRLGDDPLARRRKSASSRSSTAVTDGITFSTPASAGNPVDFLGPTPTAGVSSVESGFAAPIEQSKQYDAVISYNDVFFQRRETESALPGGVQQLEPQALENPQAVTETVPEIQEREDDTIAGVESAPIDEAVSTLEPAIESTPNPATFEALAPVEATEQQQPEAPKKGFFKKFFSAFKK